MITRSGEKRKSEDDDIDRPSKIQKVELLETKKSFGVPGLLYLQKWLIEVEEKELLCAIDESAWSVDLSRRVQHYGFKYV